MNRIKLKLASVVMMLLVSTSPAKFDTSVELQKASAKDIHCLAQNIYHEARSEPLGGQIAVAQVTVNRVKASNFTKSICRVVFEPYQFSWTNNKHHKIRDKKAWESSLIIAKAVLTNSIKMPNFTATHYHTKSVNPKWNRNMQILAVIGAHIFYA